MNTRYGADDRTRTCTLARWNLNPMSLPSPPHPRMQLRITNYKFIIPSIFTRGGTRGGAFRLIHIYKNRWYLLLFIRNKRHNLVNSGKRCIRQGHTIFFVCPGNLRNRSRRRMQPATDFLPLDCKPKHQEHPEWLVSNRQQAKVDCPQAQLYANWTFLSISLQIPPENIHWAESAESNEG